MPCSEVCRGVEATGEDRVELLDRINEMPTYTRYAAPMSFTAVKAVADAARSADRPRAAAQTCTRAPVPIPSAATAPALQPWVELRPTMYRVSGPGVILSRSPASTNNQR